MKQDKGMTVKSEISLLLTPPENKQKLNFPSLNLSKKAVDVSAGEDTSELPEQKYAIATHFVKVKRSGTLTDVTTLWDLAGTEAVSGSLDHLLEAKPGFERLPSINAFDKV